MLLAGQGRAHTTVFRPSVRLSSVRNGMYTVSQKTVPLIFTVTLANVGRFLKFVQCRNQKEMAHNKNEKFPTVA